MCKKFFFIFVILILTISLSSCTFTTTGESLAAFSNRMNEINEAYNMTPEGYIIDQTLCTLTKFYKFAENDMLLKFGYDTKYRLNEMNIVFDTVILNNSPESLTFIYDCIKCFIQNDNTSEKLLDTVNFENSIKTINMKTISAEADDIKIEIDTTRLGTVITIYKDI